MTIAVDYRKRSAVLAVVPEDAFPMAQQLISGLDQYVDYEDWLDCRQGFEMGLMMAGVEVKMVAVEIAAFTGWCRNSGARPSEAMLDVFAAERCKDAFPVRNTEDSRQES